MMKSDLQVRGQTFHKEQLSHFQAKQSEVDLCRS